MSLLYKSEEKQTISVEIKQKDGEVILDFHADCGKFGADEGLAEFKLTPKRLLKILSETESELPTRILYINNGSGVYEIFHKSDNHYVVWCKKELTVFDVYIFPDEVDWKPYPYFTRATFPFDYIEKAIREHYVNS